DFGIIDDRIMRPIGSGNLDWANIIPAAQAAGVEWYIVEQDVCQKDPFESVSDSLNFLIQNFVK
ncbi:MAG: sugar phosphate isomerase/epimerase, partial [Lentisphaeria bacterium]|nr:sugar phosphate isomerase/epimerase [Lentisphaeria bacterium]